MTPVENQIITEKDGMFLPRCQCGDIHFPSLERRDANNLQVADIWCEELGYGVQGQTFEEVCSMWQSVMKLGLER